MSSPEAVEPKSFRDVLWRLYLLWCERAGRNPENSVSVFETEAEVAEGSVSKVFRGERKTIELTSVDTLLDGLYNEGEGIITADEKEVWKEELHVSRYLEIEQNNFVKIINPNIGTLPNDVLSALEKTLREYYRQTKDYWAINIIGSTFLARRLLGNESTFVKDFKNYLNDTDWEHVWEGRIPIFTFTPEYGPEPWRYYTLWHSGASTPFNFPITRNFWASVVYSNSSFAPGIVLFDQRAQSEPKDTDPAKDYDNIIFFIFSQHKRELSLWSKTKGQLEPQRYRVGSFPEFNNENPPTLGVRREYPYTYFFINGTQVASLRYNRDKPVRTRVGLYTTGFMPGMYSGRTFNGTPIASKLKEFYRFFQVVQLGK